jgi:hypothetical protein
LFHLVIIDAEKIPLTDGYVGRRASRLGVAHA